MKVSYRIVIAISSVFLLMCALCGVGLYYTVRGGMLGYREVAQTGNYESADGARRRPSRVGMSGYRVSMRGSKAQGRIDLKMRQEGQRWWITEISFAW